MLTWLQAENVTFILLCFEFLLHAYYSPSSLHTLAQTRRVLELIFAI